MKNCYEDKNVINQMVTMYKAATNQDERDEAVKTIAKNLGKSAVSVRSKLSYLGEYIPKKRTTKDGQPIVRKAKVVDDILAAKILDLTEAEATSLEKATKTVLLKILALEPRLVGFADE